MKTAVTVIRILLGLILVASGVAGLLGKVPPPDPGPGLDFMTALASGGVMTTVKVFEVVIGLLLVVGRFVPLALVMLVPIAVNIVMYHLRFDPAGGVGAYVVGALTVVLLWAYRGSLMPLLTQRAEPLAAAPSARF